MDPDTVTVSRTSQTTGSIGRGFPPCLKVQKAGRLEVSVVMVFLSWDIEACGLIWLIESPEYRIDTGIYRQSHYGAWGEDARTHAKIRDRYCELMTRIERPRLIGLQSSI